MVWVLKGKSNANDLVNVPFKSPALSSQGIFEGFFSLECDPPTRRPRNGLDLDCGFSKVLIFQDEWRR